jgi:hypothetical protein
VDDPQFRYMDGYSIFVMLMHQPMTALAFFIVDYVLYRARRYYRNCYHLLGYPSKFCAFINNEFAIFRDSYTIKDLDFLVCMVLQMC